MARGGSRPGAGRKRREEQLSAEAVVPPVAPVIRNTAGQFVPGQSGNPAGRPKGERMYLVERYGEDARVLHEQMDKLLKHKKTPPHVKAEILKFKIERHSGKAAQSVGVTGAHGEGLAPRRVIIELDDASANP